MDTSLNYLLHESLMLKESGEDTLALNPGSLEVHELSSSAAAVARLCDGKTSCEQIVVEFAALFAISLEDAAREAYRALAILQDRKLIQAV